MKASIRPYRAQDLGRIRPTMTEEMVEAFRRDAERYTRY